MIGVVGWLVRGDPQNVIFQLVFIPPTHSITGRSFLQQKIKVDFTIPTASSVRHVFWIYPSNFTGKVEKYSGRDIKFHFLASPSRDLSIAEFLSSVLLPRRTAAII